MNTISAVQARNNFGDLLNRVLYGGEEVIIERKGKAIAKLIPLANAKPKTRSKAFLEAAGSWADLDTDKMIKDIHDARKDGSSQKEFLLDWD